MRSWTVLSILSIAVAYAGAQQVGQNKTPQADQGYTLSIQTQLVIEAVVAKDKQGNLIQGLTAKDFSVTEDGTLQTIKFCEHQDLKAKEQPLPVAPRASEEIKIFKKLSRTSLAPETNKKEPDPGNERYKDRRLIAFYFDMSAMRPADQLRALGAAEQFLRTQMTTADMISIVRYAGASVDVLQDFTGDRNRLLSILETLVVGETQGSVETADDASGADIGAAFGQDDAEFNVFNTDRQLSALQTAAQMLSRFNEKKLLIYFSSGLNLNGTNNQAQLHATVDTAIKAGVSFWPIDARGLVAEAPLGDATQGSAGNQGMYTGAAAQAVSTNLQKSQDTLFALAGDTGGKALFDTNDLTGGIVRAQQSISDYYVLGYYTTSTLQNGHFRKVKIEVTPPTVATLTYRQGYYADKKFSLFNATDKERQLEDALMLDDPITELSIAMEIDYFQLNRAEYFVPIMVKIPGRELSLAKRGGADHTLIDFVGEIKDLSSGQTVTNLRDNVNIKLSDATAAELAHRPIEYDTGYTLLPGRYRLKFLARDDETGRIGTFETIFTIPNLNKNVTDVPISSVVLSSQMAERKLALFDTEKNKDRQTETAVNPLVVDGKKIVPSVTRVFAGGKTMYVYLQAYRPAQAASAPTETKGPTQALMAFVGLYSGGDKAYETQPVAVIPPVGSRLGVTPFSFSIDLHGLAAGEYECQVTVVDPATAKATFWRAPILVLQATDTVQPTVPAGGLR